MKGRSAGPFGFRFDLPPTVPHYQLERYKDFLSQNNVTLEQLGASSWEEALPISRLNITGAGSVRLALKRRFYWGVRFYAFSASSFYSKATAALVKAAGQNEPPSIYANWNDFHGRVYTPLSPKFTKKSSNPFVAGASGVGNFDWLEARAAAGWDCAVD